MATSSEHHFTSYMLIFDDEERAGQPEDVGRRASEAVSLGRERCQGLGSASCALFYHVVRDENHNVKQLAFTCEQLEKTGEICPTPLLPRYVRDEMGRSLTAAEQDSTNA